MKHNRIIAGILFFVITAIGCGQTSDKDTAAQNQTQHDAIATATLQDVGLDRQIITELVDSIKTGFYPNRHSLLIYKDDKLVLEDYFSGHDQNWGTDIGIVQHNDTLLHDMRSVSKSVVSACIGIAISQGKIKSVDQPIFDFFEDYNRYKNEGREVLTIKHLLTMTSGLKWNEDIPYDNPENSEIQMTMSGDGIGYVLSRELTSQPGTVWLYNGGTTELLAEIIKRVSGKNIHEFAKEFLFLPMDITKSEWTISPATNSPAAASGLRLSSRAMLKFGILYLHHGKWGNKQIVPEEWIKESLTPQIKRPENGGYGYQFWIIDYDMKGKNIIIPAAVGNGDQRIYFDKLNNLLVVTTSGNYNNWDIENNASAVLKKIYTSFDFKEF
jgi:CubicO group peptidase (beta-lactamase class C family)